APPPGGSSPGTAWTARVPDKSDSGYGVTGGRTRDAGHFRSRRHALTNTRCPPRVPCVPGGRPREHPTPSVGACANGPAAESRCCHRSPATTNCHRAADRRVRVRGVIPLHESAKFLRRFLLSLVCRPAAASGTQSLSRDPRERDLSRRHAFCLSATRCTAHRSSGVARIVARGRSLLQRVNGVARLWIDA